MNAHREPPPPGHWLQPTQLDTPIDLAGRRLYFIGIGGSGVSGLARLCASLGAACAGSDRSESATAQAARDAGVAVTLDQSGQAMPDGLDAVVASAAIRPDHPEAVEAERRGVPVLKYAQMLGRLMVGRRGVAIAGTHGKSSTTAMLAHVLLHAGQDPSFILGARCEQIGGSARVGHDGTLIAEACEFDRSFHSLRPTVATVLNVEADHLDYYADLDEIVAAFAAFAASLPDDGRLLIEHACPHRQTIADATSATVETIGFDPQADYRVTMDGRLAHVERRDGERLCSFERPLPGDHMAYNAAVAAVIAHGLGVAWDAVGPALSAFRGLDRRMQTLGERDGVTVVDDYAHHPTEIAATLHALRDHHRPGRLICVFQPHQHSRTRHLLEGFAASFADADAVLVPDIFAVRDADTDRQHVSSQDLVGRLTAEGVDARHIADSDLLAALEGMAQPGDLLVTMGAGDIGGVGASFVSGRV
ncbi:MAG: UDP-N-acetylmuramate--L-alanine ligase [Planctomycetota bacterium]